MSYNSHAVEEEDPHAGIANKYLQSNGKRKPVFSAASLQTTAPTSCLVLANPEPRDKTVALIKQLFDIEELTPQLMKQLNNYVASGATYEEIEECLRLADKEGGKWSLRYGIACVANFLGKVRKQALIDAQDKLRKQLQAEELNNHKKLVFQIGRVDFSRRSKTPKYSLDYIPDDDKERGE
nr:MAG TPA: hypothetical protein [Caudoviricetes sp.]